MHRVAWWVVFGVFLDVCMAVSIYINWPVFCGLISRGKVGWMIWFCIRGSI